MVLLPLLPKWERKKVPHLFHLFEGQEDAVNLLGSLLEATGSLQETRSSFQRHCLARLPFDARKKTPAVQFVSFV